MGRLLWVREGCGRQLLLRKAWATCSTQGKLVLGLTGAPCACALPVQALILTDFEGWPADAITVEFWMLSVDKCRKGVPLSYATGGYEQADNAFLILNYNDWCGHPWCLGFQGSRTSGSQLLPGSTALLGIPLSHRGCAAHPALRWEV